MNSPKFMDGLVSGLYRPSDVGDFLDVYADREPTTPLHEYLGMTVDEYNRWAASWGTNSLGALERLAWARRGRRPPLGLVGRVVQWALLSATRLLLGW